MGFRRWRTSSFASITLINGKALPESLKGALTICQYLCQYVRNHFTGTPIFSYETI